MKNPRECGHEILNFGSGAYYIFCNLCNQQWVSVSAGTDKADACTGIDQPIGIRVKDDYDKLQGLLKVYE